MLPTEDVFVYVHAMAGDAIKAVPGSLEAGERPGRISQPQTRMKIR
jgi:hypothetical protein